MLLRHAHFPTLVATLAIACGGSVFKHDDDGSGAKGSGGSATAGKSSGGGSSKAGTSSGGASSGGNASGGGGVGAGPNCAAVDCTAADCTDDQLLVLEPGACCPTCQPKVDGCENVRCEPVKECGPGYALTQPAGACCAGCFPTGAGAACLDIGCLEPKCPLGYVAGDTYGGCCYDCVPDPLFCEAVDDCVLADKPRSCCGCPESITRRQYQAEPCWSDSSSPRMIPQSCYPQVVCDAVCLPCEVEAATCIDHRCTTRSLGLK